MKLRKEWVLTQDAREKALAKRHLVRGKELTEKTRVLSPLVVGQVVQVQNQRGQHANKWDLSGVVVEVGEFDAYLVKMDGSGRISKRNRQYLRPICAVSDILAERDSLRLTDDQPKSTTVVKDNHLKDNDLPVYPNRCSQDTVLPGYPKRYSPGLGPHTGDVDLDDRLTCTVQDLPGRLVTEGDVAWSGERDRLTAIPAMPLSARAEPTSCGQQQRRVDGGGLNTGTPAEIADGLSSGTDFFPEQQ